MDSLSSHLSQYSESPQNSQPSEISLSTDSQQSFPFQYAPQLPQPYPYHYPFSSQFAQAYPFSYAPQFQVPTQFKQPPLQAPPQSKKLSKTKKVPIGSQKKRTRNFTAKEDDALVRSWIAVSGDGIIGNSQSRTNLWNRIYDTFNNLLGIQRLVEDDDRSPNSLACRWQIIQQVNKFCGYFATIDRNPRSGTNFDDRVEDAKKTFRSCEGFDFKMEELWKILRDNPKFNEKQVASKKKTNGEMPPPPRSDGFSHDIGSVNIEDGTPQCTQTSPSSPFPVDSGGEQFPTVTSEDGVERPEMGRKKSKDRKRKGIANEGSSTIIKEFMIKFDASVQQQLALSEKEIRSKEDMLRKDLELKERHLKQKEEILHQQAQKIRMTQWFAEKEVLEKDLTGMEPHQVEIFQKIQHDIWEKWKKDGTLP